MRPSPPRSSSSRPSRGPILTAASVLAAGLIISFYLNATGAVNLPVAVGLAGVSLLFGALQLVGRLTDVLRTTIAAVAIVLVAGSFAWTVVRPFWTDWEQGDKIELVLMNWGGGGGQQEDQIVAAVVADFEAQHPNISVKRINPGDTNSFMTKLQTMMAAGTPPDVFYMATERFSAFAAQDLLMPLEPLIAADRAAGRPTVHLDDFFQPTVDCFRFDGERSGQGPLYGIPKDFTTWGIYYNLDAFDAAGVPYPTADWTWEDFHEKAQAIGQLPDMLAGAELVTWSVPIRMYLRCYGYDVATPDFQQSRLFEPDIYALLNRLRAWRYEEEKTLVSGASQVAQGDSIFVTGRIGMVGPLGRWVVPKYRDIEDFRWDFAPLPRGTQAANAVATVAWSMSKDTHHPDAAWELLKFMSGPEGQARAAKLGLAIPSLKAVAESEAFLTPDLPPANDQAYLDQISYAEVLPIPADPEWESRLNTRMEEALRSGLPFDAALEDLEADWARAQRNPLRRADFPPMPWGTLGWWLGLPALIAVLVGAAVWWRRRPSRIAFREELWGYTLLGPWLLGFFAFMAFPIVLSLLLSLAKWNGVSTLEYAQWVGLGNYQHLLFDQPRFWTSLRVTAYYALFAVPLGQLISLGAALLMNHETRLSGFFRSAWYLPSVLAGVGVAILWRWVFDGDVGLINTYLLAPLCELFNQQVAPGVNAVTAAFGAQWLPTDLEPPRWFTADAAWFGPPAFAIMSFWTIGGTMVIYLAGLKGIPSELYEAAAIDGSSLWQRFRNVTLPMLSPVIFFNGIMAVIASFQVFTQAFVMTGGGPGDATRFYVLYLYNAAFEDHHMGYASAMAWLLLVIILTLTLIAFRGSRRFVYYEALK
jgi:multiple sugar transport system permease protein